MIYLGTRDWDYVLPQLMPLSPMLFRQRHAEKPIIIARREIAPDSGITETPAVIEISDNDSTASNENNTSDINKAVTMPSNPRPP